jgi:hypothetical protein
VGGRAAAVLGVITGLLLWVVFVHDPGEPAGAPATMTTGPAYWSNPALLLGECIRFPWPDSDADMSEREVWVPIRDVQVEGCVDRLDWRVTEVNSKADGCDILADRQVSLLGLTYGDPFDYVLCLRWFRPNRT